MSEQRRAVLPNDKSNSGSVLWTILTTPIPLTSPVDVSALLGKTDLAKKYRDYMRERRKARRIAKAMRKKPEAVETVVSLEGIVARGTQTPFAIDGYEFFVDDVTWTVGEVTVGCAAKVKLECVLREMPGGETVQAWHALMVEVSASQ